MLKYNLGKDVEAFSTNCDDALDFEVVLPQHQAHSTRSAILPQEGEAITGVDALITAERGLRIGVKTADCVPILLYDQGQQVIAAIHSGWKGTLHNIISHTISRMVEELGCKPAEMKAVIGPCIHQEAFEVGDELYELFRDASYGDFMARMPRFGTEDEGVKWHIDLPSICREQLLAEEVRAIEVRPECTYTLHDQFFSARRLGAEFDRQRILNTIMIKK